MTRNHRFLTSIALTTVAAICISAMGCGDSAGGKGTTTKTVETSGTDKKPTTEGSKTDTKPKSADWDKAEKKKDGEKSAPPFPADKANASEAGSSTVPGGGVETP